MSPSRDPAKYQRERRAGVSARVRLLEYLSNKYGLTIAQYDRLLESQGGKCAVCERPPKPGRRLHVDHDHETGAVRALLCNPCNSALGLMGENPLYLFELADYAERCVQARAAFLPDAGDAERHAISEAFVAAAKSEKRENIPYLVNALREALLRLYAKRAKRKPKAADVAQLPRADRGMASGRAGDGHEAVFV